MYKYIDIHSHLYSPDFDKDREEEIQKLKDNKIATITVGTGFDSSEKAVLLAEKHNNLLATVGQHPGDVVSKTVFDRRLEKLAEHKKVVAIGECGLDYFRLTENVEQIKLIQKNIFRSHIDFSLKVDKPLMLHIRPQKGTMDAYLDVLETLESYREKSSLDQVSGKGGGGLRGNVHFFVGNLDILKRFLALGFTVSFTGVITFTRDYDEVVKYAPLDMIMSETDSPFVAPVPYRGGRNSPLYVPEVVKKIAEIRGEDFDVVRGVLMGNAIRQFSI